MARCVLQGLAQVFMRVLLLLCMVLTLSGQLHAQAPFDWGVERDLLQQLQKARDEVRGLQKQIDKNELTQRQADVSRTNERLQASAELARQSVRQLERLNQILTARLQEVGEQAQGPEEHVTVRNERKQLQKTLASLQAELRLARLVQLEATQTQQLLHESRQRYEGDKRWRREPSLLLMQSWPDLKAAWPADKASLQGYYQQWQATWQAQSWKQSDGSLWLLGGVLVAGFLTLRLLPMIVVRMVPGGRLRRSALALANLLVWGAIVTVVCQQLVLLAFDRPDLQPSQLEFVGLGMIAAMFSAVGVAAIRAIVLQPRSSWRLVSLSERAYRRLWLFPWLYTLVVYFDVLTDVVDSFLDVSHVFSLTIEAVSLLAYLLLFGYGLWAVWPERLRHAKQPGTAASWPRWLFRLMMLSYVFSWLALIGGWVGLADDVLTHFLSLVLVLGALGYLLTTLLQDISDSLLVYLRGRAGDDAYSQERSRVQGQWVILLFALARVLVLGLCVWIVSSDWLVAPRELLESGLGSASEALRLSAVQWRLDLWLLALAVLLAGVFAVNVLRRWMMLRLMPTSKLEPGLQGGLVGVLTYAAYFALLVITLTMLGLPVNAVTWIFTALTVGLGFGLRGIVQNFASGLLLMLERPVKVGDWVELESGEGNVREIRFRATYLERFDQSLLIVPNAAMMGRPLRNLTYEPSALGAVEIKLLFPLDVDADQIMLILEQAVQEQPDILADPAARLFCDGIQGDGLLFGGRCFISNVRNQRGVRSALILSVLRRLREQGIHLHPSQHLVANYNPEMTASNVAREEY